MTSNALSLDGLTCSAPDSGDEDCVTLAHGEGGRMMRQLIRERIIPAIQNEYLLHMDDAARLPPVPSELAMSTDSFVVSPLFFPGGDIGSLAVYGTVNDLAVSGAQPLWMSLALIIEEGLPLRTLEAVLASAASAAREVGVPIVTGDTKVVPRGTADGLFLTTTGIGQFVAPIPPGPRALQVGDEILVSGPIGRHGMAVMTSREGLEFDPPPTSDSASLFAAVAALRDARIPLRAMRDATRGGLSAVLHEWADESGLTLSITEQNIPITPDVRGSCELLGLDPLHVANEGTMVVAVPAGVTDSVLHAWRSTQIMPEAALIGSARGRGVVPVVVRRALGHEVPLDEPGGAQLPRIC